MPKLTGVSEDYSEDSILIESGECICENIKIGETCKVCAWREIGTFND